MKFLLCLLPLFFHTAQAETRSFAERDDVRAFIADMQTRNGFDSGELTRQFAQATPLPAVIKAIKPPDNPTIRSWQVYRSRFVEPRRIDAGVQFWRDHPATLAKAEAIYGVPREIVVGIIGVETVYGRNTGSFQTFSALTTLAFDYPPRADLFRKELEALLLLAREEKRDPLDYRGSFAGAMGLPQFLPSSIRQWAVDFDGDGKVDLDNPDDAIGSVAHYLADHGWKANGPVLAEAKVEDKAEGPNYNDLLAEGITPVRTVAELAGFGVSAPAAAPDAAALPAALIDYVTPHAPTLYRLGYHNFYVITRYNRSSFYASAVFDLAEAVKLQKARLDTPGGPGK